MKKIRRLMTIPALLILGSLLLATTDIRCPTTCPDFCAVATGTLVGPGCASWGEGFAGTRTAEAIVKGYCVETFLTYVLDSQRVSCHEKYTYPDYGDEGGDDCSGCGTGDCPASCNPY